MKYVCECGGEVYKVSLFTNFWGQPQIGLDCIKCGQGHDPDFEDDENWRESE